MTSAAKRDHRPSPITGQKRRRRMLSTVLLGAILFLVSASAGAHMTASEPQTPRYQAPMQSGVYDGLTRSWRRFVELFHSEDFAEILVRVDSLERLRIDFGIRNLSLPARTLCLIARQRLVAGEHREGEHLARAAARLAPDLPLPHYILADIAWDRGGGPFATVGHIAQGWIREWRHLPSRVAVVANRLTTALFVFVLVVLVLGATLLFRHLPTLAHDLRHLFPRGVTSAQTGLLALILLLSPLLFGVGVIPLFLLWAVVTWWYQGRAEKLVVITLLLSALVWPSLLRTAIHALEFPDSPQATYHACLDDACGDLALDGLHAACMGPQPTPEDCLVLAAVRTRQGATDRTVWPQVLQALERIPPGDARFDRPATLMRANALHGQAVAYCRERQRLGEEGVDERFRRLIDDARSAYERAAARGLNSEALFGQSQLLRRSGDLDGAQRMMDRALVDDDGRLRALRERNPEKLSVQPCDESFNPNLALPSPSLALGGWFIAGLGVTKLNDLEFPLLNTIMLGALPPVGVPVLALVLLVIAVLLSAVRSHVHPSWRCSSCMQVGCARCRHELRAMTICEECLYIQMKGSFVDAKDLWFRERRIQAALNARRRMSRIASFLLPGVGHFLQNRAWGGFILTSLFLWTLLNAIWSPGHVPEFTFADGSSRLAGQIAWGTASLLVYLVAVLDNTRTLYRSSAERPPR